MNLALSIVGVILLFAVPLTAQKPVWKSGVVVAYSYEAGTKPVPVESTDLSVDVTDSLRTERRDIIARDDQLRMQIRTEEGSYYVNQNLKYIWQAMLDLKAGNTVEVKAKDGRIQIRTNKGKKGKYRYVLFVPKEFETDLDLLTTNE